MSSWVQTLCFLWFLVVSPSPSMGIWCYDCESSKDFSCTDNMDALEGSGFLSNCTNVYQAKYCIAMRGVYEGKLGTKRFCSSRNWGTYCEYIRRPGDSRDYRSCISTCSSYACNL